jgi:hypothetical protein
MTTTYKVTTRDTDGSTTRTYKRIDGALKRFEDMAGFSVKVAFEEMSEGAKAAPNEREIRYVRGVSMYGTVVIFERIGEADPVPAPAAPKVDVVARIKELREHLDAAKESHFEHETQYRSECALYGDAGIGQGAALAEGRKAIDAMQEELAMLLATDEGEAFEKAEREAHRAAMRERAAAYAIASWDADDECPF